MVPSHDIFKVITEIFNFDKIGEGGVVIDNDGNLFLQVKSMVCFINQGWF